MRKIKAAMANGVGQACQPTSSTAPNGARENSDNSHFSYLEQPRGIKSSQIKSQASRVFVLRAKDEATARNEQLIERLNLRRPGSKKGSPRRGWGGGGGCPCFKKERQNMQHTSHASIYTMLFCKFLILMQECMILCTNKLWQRWSYSKHYLGKDTMPIWECRIEIIQAGLFV